jgi:predicted glycosyltransferase
MAIDTDKQLRLIHIHLKHKGMKMTPTYYIARNVKQIVDALNFVKYCVVKTDNNEQQLIELN